jgi:bacteriorhodopsin
MSATQEAWLWFGTIGMVIGTILLAWFTARLPEGERHHGVVSTFVTLIASAAYFAMARGQGSVTVDDRTIFYARYIDWVLTTPLLLLGLMLIALPALAPGGDARSRNALLGLVLGLDVFMIATGFLAAIAPDDATRATWYVASTAAFLVIIAALWGPIRTTASRSSAATLYTRLLVILSVLWFVYPVVWLLGTEGFGITGLDTEVVVFAIVDVTAKVAFGLVLVAGVLRNARLTSSARIGSADPGSAPA